MNQPFKTLRQLLVDGRPARWPVALGENGMVCWQDFSKRIEAHKLPPTIILHNEKPLEFLAMLLAGLKQGCRLIIPPNFQPKTLSELAALPQLPAPTEATLELYTSGTSGTPKLISKTLHQLEAECRVLEDCWGRAIDRRVVVSTTPCHHIYGLLFRLLWPLCAGRPFDCVTATEPATLKERLCAAGDAILVSSPAHLSRLPELLILEQLSPRPALVFSSGGPLLPAHAQSYASAWGTAPIEIFGSTETGGIAWRQQRAADDSWTPLPGVRINQDDDEALVVRSPFLPDDLPYGMADRIAPRKDGRFQLLGRLDRIVKIEEKRLSLPEMESWLVRHPAVAAVVLAAITTGTRQVVGAVVVLNAEADTSRRTVVDNLRTHLAQRFDRVLFPRRWRFVDRLPFNERGKLASADVVALLETQQ